MIPYHDQRRTPDRRELDVGPLYGARERRRIPERRAPEVVEVEFDDIIELLPVAETAQSRRSKT
ncbi:MAG TPA: hypothetical protein VF096_04640 [Azonexus sp.]